MKLQTIVIVLLWALDKTTANNKSLAVYEETRKEQAVDVHSRRKRYIVFPKGSSLQLLLELLVHVPTQFEVVLGPTLQVAWPLPSELSKTPNLNLKRRVSHFDNFYRFGKSPAGMKYKLFRDLAAFLDYGGADGRQCVLKALCESGQRTPSKKGFLKEILHKIFSMEGTEEEDLEEDKIYRKAHQSANQNCDTLYPDCKFSVFDAIQ